MSRGGEQVTLAVLQYAIFAALESGQSIVSVSAPHFYTRFVRRVVSIARAALPSHVMLANWLQECCWTGGLFVCLQFTDGEQEQTGLEVTGLALFLLIDTCNLPLRYAPAVQTASVTSAFLHTYSLCLYPPRLRSVHVLATLTQRCRLRRVQVRNLVCISEEHELQSASYSLARSRIYGSL
jgi:hypothetical protein